MRSKNNLAAAVLAVVLAACSFSPGGGAPWGGDDDMVVDAGGTDAADNGDGGMSIDAATDASVDAPTIPDNTVEIRLTTPDNIRSGHETEVVLTTGANVVSCVRTSTPSHSDWDGGGLVTSNPFHVSMALGLNTLTATCTTSVGQELQPVTVLVPAMLLEPGPFTWNAPGADHCTSFTNPYQDGGLQSTGHTYASSGTFPFWNPTGNSEQGFDGCPVLAPDGVTVLYRYRATIMYIAFMKRLPQWWQKWIAEAQSASPD